MCGNAPCSLLRPSVNFSMLGSALRSVDCFRGMGMRPAACCLLIMFTEPGPYLASSTSHGE